MSHEQIRATLGELREQLESDDDVAAALRTSLLGTIDGIDHIGVDLTTREVTVEHSSDTATVTAALDTLDLDASHLGDRRQDLLQSGGERQIAP